jgi:hypothetical protein
MKGIGSDAKKNSCSSLEFGETKSNLSPNFFSISSSKRIGNKHDFRKFVVTMSIVLLLANFQN